MLQTSIQLHMDSANPSNHYLHIKRSMPVLEDSDNDSSISNEDTASLTELVAVRGAADEVKQELRNVIRSRRVAKGLVEVPNYDAKRPKIEQLSPEEEDKRRLRRERNKVAAFKCRQRRKEHINILEQESDGLEEDNNTLETEIKSLKAQKEQLEEMFKEHTCHNMTNTDISKQKESSSSPETCSAEAAKGDGSLSPQSPPQNLFQSRA